MSEVVNIFGENKSTLHSDLKVRLILEDPKRINDETQLIHNVNQEAQFYAEKQASNKFRFYGTISPTLNLQLKDNEKPNYDYFKFIDENWQVVLLKPTKFNGEVGKKKFLKEDKYQYDFDYGLPCLKTIPAQEEFKNYMVFNCYLGHNIEQDDRIYISSLDHEYIKSGYYNVIGVDGNNVYINNEYVEVIPDFTDEELNTNQSIDEQITETENLALLGNFIKPVLQPPLFDKTTEYVEYITTTRRKGLFRRKKTTVTEIRSKYVAAIDIVNAAPHVTDAANNDELLQLKNIELGILNASILAEIKKKRPNISKIIKPKFFIKKVKEDYQLEYYMKQVEVIGIVKELNDCSYSLSATGEQVMNYILQDIDITGMLDNHDIPVTELYLGIIKKSGNVNKDLSDVESNFNKIINYTEEGHGLESVMEKHSGFEIDELKIGDKMFIGLCEYDKEELSEKLICQLEHRVIHRDVSFSYKPFSTLKLKTFSSYIEDSETKTEIPNYAVYSDIRQKYIWRDIHDIGFYETNGVGIDYPFLNGNFYVYNQHIFSLRNSFSTQYRYNQNDINKLENLELEIEEARDILTDLLLSPDDNKTDNKGYQEFNIKQC